MAEIIEPSGEIVPGYALVPYVHPTLTNKTPVAWPLLGTALKAWAVLMIEWGTLRWVEHTPDWAWVASILIAICVLAVIENREWLNFRGRRYFSFSLALLIISWIGVVGGAYYQVKNSPQAIDPEVAALNSQLATARRDRDLAILERDAARQSHGENVTPTSPQSASAPETIKADEIEARIDVWKSVDGQMNDLSRILGEGDHIVADWKSSQAKLPSMLIDLRNHLSVLRGRLNNLIGANPDFSDLKAVDQQVMVKLASAIDNLFETSNQLPKDIDQSGYENSITPYVGPLRRELTRIRRWVDGVKNLAASSVSDLSARQVLK